MVCPHDNFGQNATILHFIPNTYNRLQIQLDVEQALTSINRRVDDYIIIDLNAYMISIALRGQILLSLASFVFIFVMLRLAYRIAQKNMNFCKITDGGFVY